MAAKNIVANRLQRRRRSANSSRCFDIEQLEDRRVLAVTFTAEAPIVEADAVYPKSLVAADFDGDSDADIVVASYIDNKITWYENVDGEGTYGKPRVITDFSFGAAAVNVADIDGDGDLDILSASADDYDADVSWYENTDGLGTFSEQKVISAEIAGGDSVFAADLDSDGDLDVLSASRGDNKVAWYSNLDGKGQFGEQQVISDTELGATTVVAVDVDGDGDIDVIAGSVGERDDLGQITALGEIVVFENLGDGTDFERKTILTADFITSIVATDIDGDGDPDIASTSREDNVVSWLANDGGEFGPERVISLEEGAPNQLIVDDVDGDGRQDVVTAGRIGDSVTWYRNTGVGIFGAPVTINRSADGASSVFLADVDNDKDLDLFSTSRFDNKIALYKNLDGDGLFGPQQVLAAVGAPGAQLVNVADLDGDGDEDVLTAAFSNDSVLWSENLGRGKFGEPQLISDRTNGTESVVGADFDGDGDIDVASASYFDNKIAWYENLDGGGSFGPQRLVGRAGRAPEDLFAADLDGDDDIDLLTTSRYDNTISWYENVDALGTFGKARLISDSQLGPSIVRAADIDGDGDLDVMANGYDGFTFAWYENLDGAGDFSGELLIASLSDGSVPTSILASDLDSDGDLDVVTTEGGDDRVVWYENLDGRGDFGEARLISDDLDGAFFLDVADFDDDGDIDVLVGAILADVVGWYENVDSGRLFGDLQIIDDSLTGATSVLAADLNADGRPDVLATSSVLDKVSWYSNRDGEGGFPRGDFNQDRVVDESDINLLCAEIIADSLDDSFDLTGEGVINRSDMNELITNILNTEFGDSNLDGLFNSADFIQVFQRGKYEDELEDNAEWGDGDWNCDGDFTSSDLVVAFQNGGYTAATPAAAIAGRMEVAAALNVRDETVTRELQVETVESLPTIDRKAAEILIVDDNTFDSQRDRFREGMDQTKPRPLRDVIDLAFGDF